MYILQHCSMYQFFLFFFFGFDSTTLCVVVGSFSAFQPPLLPYTLILYSMQFFVCSLGSCISLGSQCEGLPSTMVECRKCRCNGNEFLSPSMFNVQAHLPSRVCASPLDFFHSFFLIFIFPSTFFHCSILSPNLYIIHNFTHRE